MSDYDTFATFLWAVGIIVALAVVSSELRDRRARIAAKQEDADNQARWDFDEDSWAAWFATRSRFFEGVGAAMAEQWGGDARAATSPYEMDVWVCSMCGSEMCGGLFCRTCGAVRTGRPELGGVA